MLSGAILMFMCELAIPPPLVIHKDSLSRSTKVPMTEASPITGDPFYTSILPIARNVYTFQSQGGLGTLERSFVDSNSDPAVRAVIPYGKGCLRPYFETICARLPHCLTADCELRARLGIWCVYNIPGVARITSMRS